MRNVSLLGITLVLLASASLAPAADPARVAPEGAVLYYEVRSPEAVVTMVEGWFEGVGGPDANPLDDMLRESARTLNTTPAEMRADLRKMKGLVFAVVDVDAETQRPAILVVAEMAPGSGILAALKKPLEEGDEKRLDVVEGVQIYGDADQREFAAVIGDVLIFANRAQDVAFAVRQIKGGEARGLDQSQRYREAMQGVGAQHPVVSFMDVPALMKSLRGQDPENDDLHAFETALDLKTVDTVASWLDTSEEKTRVHYVARLSGENRALAALRTRAARREIGGFFSDAYGLVQAGTLMDGKVQWRRLKDMIVDSLRAADEDPKDFVYSVERVEQVFGTKLDDLMEDVTDYAVGLRAGKRGYEAPPEVLLALRMKDVQRARDTMAKAEKGAIGQYEAAEMKESDIDGVRVRILAAPTADGDYAWALVGDYLLLSRRSSIVIDAVRTWKDKRSVFENGPIKRMFAGLQDPCSKLLLINPTGFLPPIERNPHAPPPPMIGATSVEDDRRIEAVIDYTQMGAILRFVFGLFQTRGAQVD